MPLKNLFEIKKIIYILAVALVIFLVLPVLVPEETPVKIIKKETVIVQEDSPLPVFPKENIFTRYIDKVKRFYKKGIPGFSSQEEILAEEQFFAQAQEQNLEDETDEIITAQDLFFSEDFEEGDTAYLADNSASAYSRDNSVNLQKGTVLTQDGLTLEPTQEGYYHKGKFYKNGTYPINADKRHIEGALSRYHSRVAQHLGKKALYFADENGNLTVSYVDKFPDEMSTDIDTYLASNKTGSEMRPQTIRQNTINAESYRNGRYDGQDRWTNNSGNLAGDKGADDIALASLRDMHAAYILAKNQIKGNSPLAEILKPFIQNIYALENALNQTNSAEQLPEELPKDIYCRGYECADSFRVAPIIGKNEYDVSSSDLDLFYSSFCGEGTCPYERSYRDTEVAEKPLDLDTADQASLDTLKEQIENSDKKMIEIAYIHPKKEYLDLLNGLKEMQLTNKNGEIVDVRLRGIERVDPNASFGDKMAGSFKNNITKDLTSTDNQVSYDTIVDRYNEVHENVRKNIENNSNFKAYKELHPEMNFDYPVAFVEKSAEKDYFRINNFDIPRGYIDEIPQWRNYKEHTVFGSYYEVPKDVLLNAPSDMVIIFVKEKDRKGITLQDGHPVSVISKDTLQNRNFKNVESTETEIANAHFNTIVYNIDKANKNAGNNQGK